MRTPASELSARLSQAPALWLATPSGAVVETAVASSPRLRLIGLAGLPAPPPVGLLIPRCRSVHTWGMRFALDVVFVAWPPGPDAVAPVTAVSSAIRPWRLVATRAAGRLAALELGAHRAEALGLARAGAAVTVFQWPSTCG
jgi:hypothetical protein